MEVLKELINAMQNGGIYFVSVIFLIGIIQLCWVVRYLYKKIESHSEKCLSCAKELQDKYSSQINELTHIIEAFNASLISQTKATDRMSDLFSNFLVAKGD